MTEGRPADAGPARILVVDDDEAVLETVCDALSTLGYSVDAAADARIALGRFRPGRYQLVVTDLAMPVMNGLELARRLRALEPALPILVFSGAIGPSGSALTAIGVTISPKPDVDGLARLVARELGPP